jgi:NAD-dependent deacetylase
MTARPAIGDTGGAGGTLAHGLRETARWLARSRWTVVLTGAGVSTESGLPDFRSAPGRGRPGGLWTGLDPMRVASASAFERDPDSFYRFYQNRLAQMVGAEPNAAHRAIARLEALGVVQLLVTQNVDRLHQRAGSRAVAEVHGNLQEARCQSCNVVVPVAEMGRQLDAGTHPRCARCGGPLRPNVVLFEEALPAEPFRRAEEGCTRCEVLLLAGSSLEVYPVAGLPQVAKDHGARVVIVNRDPTACDGLADLILRGEAGEVLPAIVAAVEDLLASQ